MTRYYVAIGFFLASLAGSFWGGWWVNGLRHDSQALTIERAAQKAGEAASEAAGKAIAGIEIKHVTVRQALEREVRENVVFRDGRCDYSDDTVRLLNRALSGYAGPDPGELPGAVRPSTGQLPGNGGAEARGSDGSLF